LKESYDEENFLSVLPNEFKVMLTHIKSLTYYDKPDYELLNNIFVQAMSRLGKFRRRVDIVAECIGNKRLCCFSAQAVAKQIPEDQRSLVELRVRQL